MTHRPSTPLRTAKDDSAESTCPAGRFAPARMSRRASALQSPLLAALAAAELASAAVASARALRARLARLTRRDIGRR